MCLSDTGNVFVWGDASSGTLGNGKSTLKTLMLPLITPMMTLITLIHPDNPNADSDNPDAAPDKPDTDPNPDNPDADPILITLNLTPILMLTPILITLMLTAGTYVSSDRPIHLKQLDSKGVSSLACGQVILSGVVWRQNDAMTRWMIDALS